MWDGCFALCDYLELLDLREKRILELGCGAGLSGLLCAYLGAQVLLTDEFTDLVKSNAELCEATDGVHCETAVLTWGSSEAHIAAGSFDFILGAELTPLRSTHHALVETISSYTNVTTRVLLTFDGDARELSSLTQAQRGFMDLMREAGFASQVVHTVELARTHYAPLLTAAVGDVTSVVQFQKP